MTPRPQAGGVVVGAEADSWEASLHMVAPHAIVGILLVFVRVL